MNSNRLRRAIERIVLTLSLTAAISFAQGTGEIHGTVSDPTGLPVSGATVLAHLADRGLNRTAITDDRGGYILAAMPIGNYVIEASQQGFKTMRRTAVALTANENVRADFQLELGAVAESVAVEAVAPIVDTRSSTVATLIDARRVTDLPINGRNIVSLAQLLPGVSEVSAPQMLLEDRDGPTIAVAGSRPNQNLFLFDGAHFNALFRNTGLNYPPPDALQEVKVLTNSFSAEYGRNAGSIINVVTRSGTNRLHGSLWEFYRNQHMNARNFFSASKPKLNQNQFGAAVGGPIAPNRLFFFGSYEALRVRPDALTTSAFPLTAAERSGDFSTTSTAVRDPLTQQPFPDRRIPASRFDPVARTILERNLMPLPNRPSGQLVETAPAPQDNNQALARLDWNRGRHTIDGRYHFSQATAIQYVGQVPAYITVNARTRGQNATIGDTFTISPSILNQFRISFNRIAAISGSDNTFSLSDLGGTLPEFGPKLPPAITVTGRVVLSNNSPTVPGRANDTFQISDSISIARGSHSLKAGVDLFRTRLVQYSAVNTMGVFTFGGQLTGVSAADFLIGRPTSMNIGSPVREQGGKQNSVYGYLQDDWKITPRLTLNLGIRYELPKPWYHPNRFWGTLIPGQQSQVIPNAPLGMVYPGDPGVPDGLVATDRNNFAPRFGFAWDPFGQGRTSIRGAYGIFYETMNGDIIQNEGQPFSYTFTIPAPFSLSDPLRGQAPIPTTNDFKNPLFTGRQQLSYPDRDLRTGYVQQFNLNVQQQISGSLAIQAGYVGRVGRKLMLALPSNPAVFEPGATLGNINQRRLLPDFGNNRVISAQANSNFHSLQVEVTRRFSRGFSLQAAYTFSRSIDQSSGITTGLGAAAPNIFDLRSQYGLSDFHAKHIGSTSWVWEVPATSSQNPFVGALLHNWQVNGLIALRTGRPINILSGRDDALSGTQNQRPDVVGDHRFASDRSRGEKIQAWFNRAAFAFPAPGQYGNAGRNALIGPSSAVTNLALFKSFALPGREGLHLQFRFECFNAFNSVNLGQPNASLSAGASMGRITSANDARVIQLALKLKF